MIRWQAWKDNKVVAEGASWSKITKKLRDLGITGALIHRVTRDNNEPMV